MQRINRYALHAITTLVVVVALVTLVWPQWFEALTGTDPDGGDGSLERWISRGLALVALVVAIAVQAIRRGSLRAQAPVAKPQGNV